MVEKQSVAVFINIVFRQRKGEKHLKWSLDGIGRLDRLKICCFMRMGSSPIVTTKAVMPMNGEYRLVIKSLI